MDAPETHSDYSIIDDMPMDNYYKILLEEEQKHHLETMRLYAKLLKQYEEIRKNYDLLVAYKNN